MYSTLTCCDLPSVWVRWASHGSGFDHNLESLRDTVSAEVTACVTAQAIPTYTATRQVPRSWEYTQPHATPTHYIMYALPALQRSFYLHLSSYHTLQLTV